MGCEQIRFFLLKPLCWSQTTSNLQASVTGSSSRGRTERGRGKELSSNLTMQSCSSDLENNSFLCISKVVGHYQKIETENKDRAFYSANMSIAMTQNTTLYYWWLSKYFFSHSTTGDNKLKWHSRDNWFCQFLISFTHCPFAFGKNDS